MGVNDRQQQALELTRQLQSIAQDGIDRSLDPFDRDRFRELREIAAIMSAAAAEGDIPRISGVWAGGKWPPTPKVDVRGAVIDGGRILLVRDRREQLWSLPGGWAEVGLTPTESVEREVLEETGYRVQATRCLFVHDNRKSNNRQALTHVYKIFFWCEIESGSPASNLEVDEVGLFLPESLPPLSTPRTTASQIRAIYDLSPGCGRRASFD